MSDEQHADGREPFESNDHDSLHQDLPFGMAGVTSMLERLRPVSKVESRALRTDGRTAAPAPSPTT